MSDEDLAALLDRVEGVGGLVDERTERALRRPVLRTELRAELGQLLLHVVPLDRDTGPIQRHLSAVGQRGATAAGIDSTALLAQYLDDGYADRPEDLAPPLVVTPLDLRLHEAVGQPLATGSLPLIYAWSDLGQNGGWKARLDA